MRVTYHRVGRGLRGALSRLGHDETTGRLGDFTTTTRVVPSRSSPLRIGALSAFVALALLRLIGLFTNLFFYQRVGLRAGLASGQPSGLFVIVVPVIGALIIGLMARYGSERIRGHGIPEAIEAILINGSRVEPKRRGAQAAVVGHLDRVGRAVRRRGADHHDRRRLRLARRPVLPPDRRGAEDAAGGRARRAGMSATFATPVAAVLLAVELLLFEWKPRSLIPVALASATAAVTRRYILGAGAAVPGAAPRRVHRRARRPGAASWSGCWRAAYRCC